MSQFLSESGYNVPFDAQQFIYTDAIVVLPSGDSFEDTESRLISDTAVVLSSQLQFSSVSGVLGIATASGGWITITLG